MMRLTHVPGYGLVADYRKPLGPPFRISIVIPMADLGCWASGEFYQFEGNEVRWVGASGREFATRDEAETVAERVRKMRPDWGVEVQ